MTKDELANLRIIATYGHLDRRMGAIGWMVAEIKRLTVAHEHAMQTIMLRGDELVMECHRLREENTKLAQKCDAATDAAYERAAEKVESLIGPRPRGCGTDFDGWDVYRGAYENASTRIRSLKSKAVPV